MLTLLAAITVLGFSMTPEVVFGLITTFVSPVVTQFLKGFGEKFSQYSTFVNQIVAVIVMTIAWMVFDRTSPYETWFVVAMGAGGAGTSLYNVFKQGFKKKNA